MKSPKQRGLGLGGAASAQLGFSMTFSGDLEAFSTDPEAEKTEDRREETD